MFVADNAIQVVEDEETATTEASGSSSSSSSKTRKRRGDNSTDPKLPAAAAATTHKAGNGAHCRRRVEVKSQIVKHPLKYDAYFEHAVSEPEAFYDALMAHGLDSPDAKSMLVCAQLRACVQLRAVFCGGRAT